MAIKIRGRTDGIIRQIRHALESYAEQHSNAQIEIYRRGPVSVRIRIIDSDFSGSDINDRHNLIWAVLQELPEEVQSDISVLLLLTPEETRTSFANMEFDHPVPLH